MCLPFRTRRQKESSVQKMRGTAYKQRLGAGSCRFECGVKESEARVVHNRKSYTQRTLTRTGAWRCAHTETGKGLSSDRGRGTCVDGSVVFDVVVIKVFQAARQLKDSFPGDVGRFGHFLQLAERVDRFVSVPSFWQVGDPWSSTRFASCHNSSIVGGHHLNQSRSRLHLGNSEPTTVSAQRSRTPRSRDDSVTGWIREAPHKVKDANRIRDVHPGP